MVARGGGSHRSPPARIEAPAYRRALQARALRYHGSLRRQSLDRSPETSLRPLVTGPALLARQIWLRFSREVAIETATAGAIDERARGIQATGAGANAEPADDRSAFESASRRSSRSSPTLGHKLPWMRGLARRTRRKSESSPRRAAWARTLALSSRVRFTVRAPAGPIVRCYERRFTSDSAGRTIERGLRMPCWPLYLSTTVHAASLHATQTSSVAP
jgi:hypothetical protein